MRAVPTLISLIWLAALGACASAPAQHPILWRTGLWCGGAPAFKAAARVNAIGRDHLQADLFGRLETGWAIYAPAIDRDIAVQCPPESPGFAGALAHWQGGHGLTASGEVDAATLAALKAGWQARRPFVALRAAEACPDPPPAGALETAQSGETLGGKPVRLRRAALAAWRRMTAAAWAEIPDLGDEPTALRLFSGYRDPAEDTARCAREHNCQGLVRAACSAHRTGLALDLDVGAAPGFSVDSSSDANRLYQSRTPAYRWLARNAARFGFVNYAFEPWHWEWTGEKP